MEDGSNGPLSDVEVSDTTKNGVVPPIMAKFPDGTVTAVSEEKTNHVDSTKINGETNPDNLFDDDSYSSESDALIIDESVPKKQKGAKKKNKHKNLPNNKTNDKTSQKGENLATTSNSIYSSPVLTHSNPFFNESLFELSQLHQTTQEPTAAPKELVNVELKSDKNAKQVKAKKAKPKPKPKLREYAQYLGLQPAVQFKCSKCGRAGFESFATLQEHILQCNAESVPDSIPENSGSGFKLTRKVFLCSACGTYYENWNLYMHMIEFHKRYICLYCLGMFSVLEDLCQHIQSRHNLEPGYKNSPDEFFSVYNEPCYVVCCECNKLFSEQDNFFYHNCSKSTVKTKKPIKTQITPENHVTGETEAIDEPSSLDKEVEEINNSKNRPVIERDDKIEDSNATQTNKESDNMSVKDEVSGQESGGENEKNNDNDDFMENSYEKEDGEQTKVGSGSANEEEDKLSEKEEEDKNCNSSGEVKEDEESDDQKETRKVPKLSLKLPKPSSFPEMAEDSDDSEKLTMEVDQVDSENDNENEHENENVENENNEGKDGDLEQEKEQMAVSAEGEGEPQDNVEEENKEDDVKNDSPQVAGPDIPIIELELEQPLDKFDPRVLLQKCLKTTVPSCIYCNHARKIAVNGKQLALHCIAEHRFSAVVNSITAEELIPENFVNRFKDCLDELEAHFFNLESSFSNEAITFSHLFECFQCYFSTSVHKELYLHNRKFHSKNLLLCIMCKSNFYSYSELICHLCPGLYVLDYDLQFRCCMCVNDDLPSSFRLMVHLRKKHNICDVCLEMCHTQYRLSNHVWKHKLHHFCYRCGIAYRNKPDITRHLFWKHGTESVLCKKCLQKKWPHVYHFCVPPASFTCDECNLNFTRAVSLKVHKRIHTDEKKHACNFESCEEKFISKKLLLKHEKWHLEPPEEEKEEEKVVDVEKEKEEETVEEKPNEEAKEEEKLEEKPKPKIDVLDLPALNLSESDSSDSEPENANKPNITTSNESETDQKDSTKENPETDDICKEIDFQDKAEEKSLEPSVDDLDSSNSVIQNIWDNFKNYQASKEKIDNLFEKSDEPKEKTEEEKALEETKDKIILAAEIVLLDHDYCFNPEKTAGNDSSIIEVKPALSLADSVDHDYCSSKPQGMTSSEKPETSVDPPKTQQEQPTQKAEIKKAESSSSSSSDSDSSSCSCGSNCSCSSSSASSSSSSDSSNSDSSTEEGRKKQLARRQKRRERAKKMKENTGKDTGNKPVEVVATAGPAPTVTDAPIRESDLETTESETDEEFYDKAPQKLAKKILEEKRQQLLATVGPNSFPNGSFIESTSRPPTPPAGVVEEPEERKKSKKSKSKKKKKKKSERAKEVVEEPSNIITPDVPIPPYYQQFHQQLQQPSTMPPITLSLSRNSPVQTQSVPTTPVVAQSYPKVQGEPPKQESTDSNLRASKRRRVPNKFYGYSSDEETEKVTPVSKWRKTESSHTSRSPLTVPPITIKTTPQPPPPQVVEPISIRTGTHLSDFRVQRPKPRPSAVPPRKLLQGGPNDGKDSATESNDSSSEEPSLTPKPAQPQLYCYCRCPYDEVSEMIGCDASDCAIEWFHFECVGIMVPPKGQWFCPDCRKKKQQRREMLLQQQQLQQQSLGSQQGV